MRSLLFALLAVPLCTVSLAADGEGAAGEIAQDSQPAPKGVHTVKGDEEIVVYGDLFSRWDGTRWYIATEVQVPQFIWFRSTNNYEMRVQAFQVHTVLACSKDWKLSGRKYEVHCNIEDIGLTAVVFEKNYEHAQAILDEMDDKLTGANLQMQVKDNGRVTNIDLEGMPVAKNRRERSNQETMRLLLSRLVVGYDMKLRKFNYLATGQWVENRSALLSMPSTCGGGQSGADCTGGTLTPASGLIVHQLNGYQGHLVVQTKGEGQIQGDGGQMYKAELSGVTIYDEEEGYMTERVWSLTAKATADAQATFGLGLVDYHHSGVLRLLNEGERVEIVDTTEVRIPSQKNKGHLPLWKPLRPPT
ncbi:MAG: hypothetical protein ACI9MC_004150 [Kiritimatiellia bacterium]|jgi:hypothetical protein